MLLMCVMQASAQSISVKSFSYAEADQSANSPGQIVYDQNGLKCALVKVKTPYKDFYFDVGSLGVMKVEEREGETWVYVPEGVKRMRISHQQFGTLRDYDLGMMLRRARTYLMDLTTAEVQTLVGSIASWEGEAEITSSPSMADIYIDGRKVGQTPMAVSGLSSGQHQVRISKLGCKDYTSTIDIKGNETVSLDAGMERTQVKISVGDVTFTMVQVEGGTFQMGATSEQKVAYKFERPVHEVTLSSYMIGETEVTQELWGAVMGSNNSLVMGDNLPVDQVSWDECQEFITKLNKMTGKKFRLPTEAEWEFAARGGRYSQGYMYSGGNDLETIAWYWANSGDKHLTKEEFGDRRQNNMQPHEVKTKQPNELGIYDMSGNVFEWCQDFWGKEYYASSPYVDPKGPAGPDEPDERVKQLAKLGNFKKLEGHVMRGGSFMNEGYRVCHREPGLSFDKGSGNGRGFRLAL